MAALVLCCEALLATPAGADLLTTEVGTAAAEGTEGASAAAHRLVLEVRGPDAAERAAESIGSLAATRGADLTVVPLPLSGQVAIEGSAADVAAIRPGADDLVEVVGSRGDPGVSALGTTPTDPGWYRQTSMGDVGFEDAWEAGTGSASTVLAVIDTGVDPSPDLAGRLLPGINLVPRANPAPVGDDTDTSDDNGHGSAVAAVAAARGNDDGGIAGACWQCLVLPVRVLDEDGEGSLSTVAEGIRWAVDHGADVINLSLGGPSGGPDLDAALAYAAAGDVVVVAAAGNDGSTTPHYPAAVGSVLAVAGTSTYDPPTVHGSSTRGSGWVDVAAPFCNRVEDSSRNFCGTSSAAPLVAGLAALVRSDVPTMGATEVRGVLESTATPVLPSGSVASGAVRAGEAVQAALVSRTADPSSEPAPPVVLPAPDVTSPVVGLAAPWTWTSGAVTTSVRAEDPAGVASVHLDVDGTEVASAVGGGTVGLTWDSTVLADGWHLVRARAVDPSGNVGAAEVWWPVDNRAPSLRISQPRAKVVNRGFTVGYDVADQSGIKATLVASGGRWIAVSSGTGHFEAAVPVSGPGEVWVVAITVDHAGRASFSNVVRVWSTAKARRSTRRRR